ncbi:hypothetical protein [Burkholderia gladioli]|uniref:hypothetical protein n=1 Tax=Burkholderia gladioli TaxID=28095 RepID=UPI00163FFC5F|nr:hypothetical protein [Burkholderia gladioli]
MKRDNGLIFQILEILETSERRSLKTNVIEKQLNSGGATYDVSLIAHHFDLANDRGIIATTGDTHRITDAGHNALEAARQRGQVAL